MLLGIAGVVVVAICASYGVGRLFGLGHCMAILVARGNSICCNSAIAAVAPVIRADAADIVAAITFVAVLGHGLEPLVLAILLGTMLRSAWTPAPSASDVTFDLLR